MEIEEIIEAVKEVLGVDPINRCRKRKFVDARRITAHFAFLKTGLTSQETGDKLGGLDHATILFYRRSAEYHKTDRVFLKKLEACTSAIEKLETV